ncbi:MAG TPA: PHP domain-containing protein [Streptosporangiaceae bacterium]|nr:PHP domain-containing protein [Streptosporangiaceae bacterium]
MRIDLHVHSSASDGTDPPAEVARRAAAAGLDVVALTDHDTMAGIAPAAAALPPGLTLVPGLELSCVGDGRSMHLLGYLCDPGDPALAAETALIRDDRVHRARAMVARLRELGAPVTWEQVAALAGDAVVGRPHIARALAEAGVVATPADAFSAEWIADGGRAHVGRYAPDAARGIALVRAAGGVPVLAHPRSPGYEITDEVIAGLAAAGLAGLEVFHPDHDHSERMRLTQLANSLDLVMTGGSDDHGSFNDSGLGSETTPPEQYERLLALATGARPVTSRGWGAGAEPR